DDALVVHAVDVLAPHAVDDLRDHRGGFNRGIGRGNVRLLTHREGGPDTGAERESQAQHDTDQENQSATQTEGHCSYWIPRRMRATLARTSAARHLRVFMLCVLTSYDAALRACSAPARLRPRALCRPQGSAFPSALRWCRRATDCRRFLLC